MLAGVSHPPPPLRSFPQHRRLLVCLGPFNYLKENMYHPNVALPPKKKQKQKKGERLVNISPQLTCTPSKPASPEKMLLGLQGRWLSPLPSWGKWRVAHLALRTHARQLPSHFSSRGSHGNPAASCRHLQTTQRRGLLPTP